jgi:hypothetical protein
LAAYAAPAPVIFLGGGVSVGLLMAGKIFINYRRGDDPGFTGRLFDRLEDAFPPEQLFMDVDSIAPGLDFVRVLEEQVAACDIFLAVIGQHWLDARDAAGNRRLDNPGDFVRIEDRVRAQARQAHRPRARQQRVHAGGRSASPQSRAVLAAERGAPFS